MRFNLNLHLDCIIMSETFDRRDNSVVELIMQERFNDVEDEFLIHDLSIQAGPLQLSISGIHFVLNLLVQFPNIVSCSSFGETFSFLLSHSQLFFVAATTCDTLVVIWRREREECC